MPLTNKAQLQMSKIDFYFDYASLNAYLAYRAIDGLIERTGATLQMHPVLLGGIFKATNNQSPFFAFAGIKGRLDYERLEIHRFMDKHEITNFKMNEFFPINTLQIMRGAIVAERDGFLDQYTKCMMSAMWEENRKMDEIDQIRDTLINAGMDADFILSEIQTADVKNKLIENTNALVERNTFGLPTLFVGDEMWFGKERLGQIEEYILESK